MSDQLTLYRRTSWWNLFCHLKLVMKISTKKSYTPHQDAQVKVLFLLRGICFSFGDWQMWFQFLAGSVISWVTPGNSLSLGVCLLICTVVIVAASVSAARKTSSAQCAQQELRAASPHCGCWGWSWSGHSSPLGKLRSSFWCFALTKTNHTLPKLVYLGRPGES